MTFQSVAGKRYVVRRATALDGAWTTVGEPFEAPSNKVELPVAVPADASAAIHRIQLAE